MRLRIGTELMPAALIYTTRHEDGLRSNLTHFLDRAFHTPSVAILAALCPRRHCERSSDSILPIHTLSLDEAANRACERLPLRSLALLQIFTFATHANSRSSHRADSLATPAVSHPNHIWDRLLSDNAASIELHRQVQWAPSSSPRETLSSVSSQHHTVPKHTNKTRSRPKRPLQGGHE